MTAIAITETYELIDCPSCGFAFALPEAFLDRRRKDGRSVYCPVNGEHRMNWGESEADKLRKQLEAKDRRIAAVEGTLTHVRDQRDASERALRAQRGANTKLRKRVANGVCPCCNRSFANVERHMSTQHPDFAAGAAT